MAVKMMYGSALSLSVMHVLWNHHGLMKYVYALPYIALTISQGLGLRLLFDVACCTRNACLSYLSLSGIVHAMLFSSCRAFWQGGQI